MNCEQVRELEAAFALGALDDDERRAFVEHVRGCGEHHELADHLAVAVLLGAGEAERLPPPALRARIMESAGAPAATPVWRRWQWLGAAAAVVVVAATAALAFAGRIDGDGTQPYVHEFATDGGLSVRVEARYDERRTQVTFRGLDQGGEYEFWAIRGDEWLSVGQFSANPEGRWAGEFNFPIEPDDSICLTERATGTPDSPFGEPLFIEPLGPA